jgi:hypothetical protein
MRYQGIAAHATPLQTNMAAMRVAETTVNLSLRISLSFHLRVAMIKNPLLH